jgi:hypothetical protein
MIFVLLDYQGGIDSFIGTILFQPILGALFSILTIVICLLVGLPIRISKRINLWWTDRFRLPVASAFCGFSLMIISLLPAMMKTVSTMVDNEVVKKQVPNIGAAAAGWLLISFSLLHVFPPKRLILWIEQIICKYTSPESKNIHEHN